MKIIDNKHDYTNLAVSVTLSELAKRNVSEEEVSHYKEEQVKELKQYIRANIIDDLKIWLSRKAFTMCFSFLY